MHVSRAAGVFAAFTLAVFSSQSDASPRPPWPSVPEGQTAEIRFEQSDCSAIRPAPLFCLSLQRVESFSGHALRMAGPGPALLVFPQTESSNQVILSPEQGTIRFWVAPEWNSGAGPGTEARLLEWGAWSDSGTDAWWSLVIDAQGKAIRFLSHTGVEAT